MMNDDLLHTAIYMHKSQETPPPPPRKAVVIVYMCGTVCLKDKS